MEGGVWMMIECMHLFKIQWFYTLAMLTIYYYPVILARIQWCGIKQSHRKNENYSRGHILEEQEELLPRQWSDKGTLAQASCLTVSLSSNGTEDNVEERNSDDDLRT